jgi:NAD(P)-dependent dehydrogenase (short-subunit alcohol dehydrogenase family)
MTTPDFAGRVVAITGGARGIGQATARAFATAGARVAIGDLDGPLAEQTAAEIAGLGTSLDVTSRASMDSFIATVQERLGPIDVFINNAGIMPTGPFLDESDELAERQLAINLGGVIHGMKAILPSMRARGSGHVVNVASGAGKLGFPGVATYCATKHAVVGLTEAARAEFLGSGISFHIVMPAVVRTELTSGVPDGRGLRSIAPQDVASAIVRSVASGKVDIFVPAEMGVMARIAPLLPRALRDWSLKLTRADRVMLDTDRAARRTYQERIGQTATVPADPPRVAT